MDANGTKFHLLKGVADWQQCREMPDFADPTLADWTEAEWDNRRQSVRLRSRLTLFRTPSSQPLPLSQRRGADRDAYGSFFWISEDKQAIQWIPASEEAPLRFWLQEAAEDNSGDTFQPTVKPTFTPFVLSGLAVNSEHYLIVGYHGAKATDDKGLLIFDLYKGGPPTRQVFPRDFKFQPFAMSADTEGNVWILDRANRQYWGLDSNFHLLGLHKKARRTFMPTNSLDRMVVPRIPECRFRRRLPNSKGFRSTRLRRSASKPWVRGSC